MDSHFVEMNVAIKIYHSADEPVTQVIDKKDAPNLIVLFFHWKKNGINMSAESI